MWLKFHQNRRYLIFQGWQKNPIRGLTIIEKSWNYGNLPYLVANTYGLNAIKIEGIWIFQGGRSPLLGGLHVTCDAHFLTRTSYSSQKSCVKIWFGFIEPFKSYHLNFPWGINPLLRGLHVTCDAHFRAWPSYCSQKSCANIWLGFVEPFKSYRSTNIFLGGQKPPIRGVGATFDLQSGKNCQFTAFHRQLAPLPLDHIGSRPFFLRGIIIVFIFLPLLLANCLTPSALSNLKSCTNIHGDIGTGN